jgi:Xaa-Pro aminopeptidase
MTNLNRLQAKLKEESVPALLVSQIDNVQWASGFTGSFGYIIATTDEALFITDSRYAVQSKEEIHGVEIVTFASPTELATFIADHAKRMNLNQIGFEAQSVSYATYQTWKAKMAPIELLPIEGVIEPLRLVKTADEIEKIRRACALADKCFDHVLRLLQPGVREYDIALEIEFYFRRQGADVAFPSIVVSGDRSARPHGKPSEKVLERGDFVTMDFGAKLDGYNSDITRTVVIQEVSDRHREVYETVLKSQLAALAAMKPGMLAGDVDQISRDSMGDLAKFFGHGLGHSLGKVVHDGGRMGSNSKTVLEPGQVWTVEPGVYIEGFGGVRIEDDVVVTEDGIDILTHSTKELLVLPRG